MDAYFSHLCLPAGQLQLYVALAVLDRLSAPSLRVTL